jgi:hypothetical protein
MRLTPLFLCVVLGCSVKTDKSTDTTATVDTLAERSLDDSGVGAAAIPAAPATGKLRSTKRDSSKTPASSAPTSSTASSAMTVTEYGVGPIRAGMTVEQAAQAMGGGFAAPKGATSGCTYAVLTKAPPGLAVMLQDGKVARVDVRSGATRTAAGARIGDTEARIKTLYDGRITTTPHKYVKGGHYITVAPADTSYRIVFETDGKKVTSFRSGRVPEVEQVEGCG